MNITIIITTNPVAHWTPSTKLIQHIVNQQHLSQLFNCKWVVVCDTQSAEHEYFKALQQPGTFKNSNMKFLHNHPGRSGLKWSFIQSAEHIQTDYVLFLEHDWIFEKEVDWQALTNLMDAHDFVHKISFNKRANQIQSKHCIPFKPEDPVANRKGLFDSVEFIQEQLGLPRMGCKNDTFMEIDDRLQNSGVDMLKCLRWSNNPFLARADKFRDWVSLIDNGRDGNRSHGVERELCTYFRKDCYNMGWDQAFRKWGVYLYGKYNDGRAVRHVNGRAHKWS